MTNSEKASAVETIVIGAWNEWSEELPKKGEHVKIIDSDGEEYKWLFRCSCPNPKCKEIRSLSGAVIITPKLWQYQ